MSKTLIKGLDFVVEHKLSVRQAEIISSLIDKPKTIQILEKTLKGTSIKALQANIMKLKIKGVIDVNRILVGGAIEYKLKES